MIENALEIYIYPSLYKGIIQIVLQSKGLYQSCLSNEDLLPDYLDNYKLPGQLVTLCLSNDLNHCNEIAAQYKTWAAIRIWVR